ncbi:MAG: alpha/beta fold hydrolase [Hyphomicrobium sp.]|nr:alpha/beta fold hydrolase [Hyphomicrobium sp.]
MTEIKPVGATVPPTQEFNTPATFLPNLNYGIGLGEKDSYSATALAEVLDRVSHASLAKLTLGLSPASLVGAYLDWAAHLATSPGKRLQLADKAWRKALRLQQHAWRCAVGMNHHGPCIDPLPQDHRFESQGWQRWPFNTWYQAHLLAQQWWHVATTNVPGVSMQHERMVAFTARQILDVFSPSNFIFTNPDVVERTVAEGGRNLLRGWQNLIEDWDRMQGGRPPVGAEAYLPGETVAVTRGKVVLRNALMELIQYSPSTETVRPEPVLVVPAWIMKYYILDLSPENSLIKYLVDRGFTVFAISWRNPDPSMRDTSLDDYRRQGVLAALEAVSTIVPGKRIHGAGYCLGGTLLAISAAAIARNGTSPFASLSFLAAQVDFTEPGELQLFINESQLQFLEDLMWEQGFLDARQMSGAFQLLRSNDLIWSRVMRHYLLGERSPMTDMMAWNADTTRMPYRMQAEYLRRLYLGNDLAEGRYTVDERPVSLGDIRQPIFCVGTVKDHVAPWRSVYKWIALTDTDVTFVLTEGGHNAGIVSEPGHRHRSYRMSTHHEDEVHTDPDTWAMETPVRDGSWWPAWAGWLEERSGEPAAPPAMGAPDRGFAPLAPAPGLYVMGR